MEGNLGCTIGLTLPIPKQTIPSWGLRLSFLPQKGVFWGLRGNPHLPPPDSKRWAQLKECIVHACTIFETCSHHTHYGTPFLWPNAYKARVEDVSPCYRIEQIHVGGSKGRPYPSQSEQYLIGAETKFPPTKRRLLGKPLSSPFWFKVYGPIEGVHSVCVRSFWDLLTSPHTYYGTPFLRPSAYKARVKGVSHRCGIKQIHVGGSEGRRCLS